MAIEPDSMGGKVYLVGAGPGDPELLTLKAARLLRNCDAVLYDYLAPREILGLAPPGAELIYVGKQGGGGEHSLPQAQINGLLKELAAGGKVVVRLKGGDPFIFGRGGEEAEFLAAEGVEFELVPGVSSVSAAPAYAGIPLTHRNFTSSIAIITGHEDPDKPFGAVDWDAVARGLSSLVILMGMKNLSENMRRLVDGGLAPSTPVVCIRWGTTPRQETLTGTVGTIADDAKRAGFRAPAVIVVGKVVNFRDSLRWFESKPLFGRKIVVTRAAEQAAQLAAPLKEAGAEAFEAPTIEIVPQLDHPAVNEAYEALEDYDIIIITSANGARYFFDGLRMRDKDARSLANAKIAAIGPATTKALKERGLRPDIEPEEFKAEGLLEALAGDADLKSSGVKGARILLARAEEAREVLPETLREMGAHVTIAPIYAARIPKESPERVREAFSGGKPDMITFASSSAARNFMETARELDMDGVAVACIGPVTSDTVRHLGLTVAVQSEKHTIPALVQAIIDYYSKAR